MYEFKGHSWEELCEALGVKTNLPEWEKELLGILEGAEDQLGSCDFDDNHIEWTLLHNTRHYLAHSIGAEREADVVKIIHEFLTALCEQSKDIGYWHPIWKALLDIKESPHTLIRATCQLLPSMWV